MQSTLGTVKSLRVKLLKRAKILSRVDSNIIINIKQIVLTLESLLFIATF